jgi:outer membrane protein assembly factor BamE
MTMRKTILLFISLFCFALASGCVYRSAISQGNLVEQEDLDQVEIGMTMSQVRFLLGTPMIDDAFSKNRWDYVYYLRIKRKAAVSKRWVTIYFEDEKVTEIRKDQELSPEL